MKHQKEGYENVPEWVLERKNVKLLGHFPIQADNPFDHNKPDLIPDTTKREMLYH